DFQRGVPIVRARTEAHQGRTEAVPASRVPILRARTEAHQGRTESAPGPLLANSSDSQSVEQPGSFFRACRSGNHRQAVPLDPKADFGNNVLTRRCLMSW